MRFVGMAPQSILRMQEGRRVSPVVASRGLPDAGVWRRGPPRAVRCGPAQEPPAWETPGSSRPVSSPWQLLVLAWLMAAAACAAQGTDPGELGCSQAPRPHRHPRQLPSDGAWTHWGGWSVCSSTCGDGVSFRTRRCIRFPEEQPCRGKPRQYRACDLAECPSGSVPFRAIQCALYNGKSILGGQTPYQWVPFHGAPNLCDLNCLAVGHNFYYTFGRVLDGTRCGKESPDLCINGQCLRVGCDGTLGSEAREDACGVCDGGNQACLLVKEVFRAVFPTSGFFGYKNVTRIPAGAWHIKVTDRSRNYLALMDTNQRYLINGDWAIDRPGVYEAAGTQVRYTRTADTHESFEAAGPTREDLTIMVLFQAPNPGIEYEFWVPREPPRPAVGHASPLRQQQTREAGGRDAPAGPHPLLEATAAPPVKNHAKEMVQQSPQELGPAPPRTPSQPGTCGKCRVPKGRSQRLSHYCRSDFVFRARVLTKRYVGQETRYDLQVKEAYRNRFPLIHREYVWVPNACDCPPLTERREYVLMARRHVNFEHTLNRILLPPGGYARPWTPREDRQLRELAGSCGGA